MSTGFQFLSDCVYTLNTSKIWMHFVYSLCQNFPFSNFTFAVLHIALLQQQDISCYTVASLVFNILNKFHPVLPLLNKIANDIYNVFEIFETTLDFAEHIATYYCQKCNSNLVLLKTAIL